MTRLFFYSALLVVCMGSEQYVSLDAASASSTYSTGNLAGSPAFTAQQALSGGSGYWCSSGSHGTGQVVTWAGVLNSRRQALGVKIDWAYSPGEVKVLTSSDGSNFEEAKCWQPATRSEVAYAESIMFDTPLPVKAITISMRTPLSWGYFGINSVALLASPGPFMLVSGITSPSGEQCLVNGASLEPCLDAIAAGDGREIMQFDEDGQIVSVKDGSCLTLTDGDTTAGGSLNMQACSATPEGSDGRTVFATQANGQLKMPKMGNYCLTMLGDAATKVDIASAADVSATSSSAQHSAASAVDGNAQSYWASGFDPNSAVDMILDFGAAKKIEKVEISWEYPPLAFELQVATGGAWKNIFATSGNNLDVTKYLGPAVAGSVLRIRMTKPHPTLGTSDGHSLYAMKNIQVLATSTRMVVQDCTEAEENTDARDKFFMVAVPEFDPSVPSLAQDNAALLTAASTRLGSLLAELYTAMPSLAACRFVASFGKSHINHSVLTTHQLGLKSSSGSPQKDAVFVASSGIATKLGVDFDGLLALFSKTKNVFTQISR